MRATACCLVAVLLAGMAIAEPAQLTAPQMLDIPSGNLRLKAHLWKPAGSGPFPCVLFNHGSGGIDAAHTAGMPITEAAERLAPVFVKHGYAFLYLYRRGQGLSADQAPFLPDLLQREEVARGKVSRQHLQDRLLRTEQLDDVLAALSILNNQPGIDPWRIAIAGQSFGGNLTLLAAGREPRLRAAVAFAAAANSWQRSPELRETLVAAVRSTAAPIMLVYAANDYDTAPGVVLAAELERLHKPHVLKIYPPVGQSNDDGHNMMYIAMPLWEGDVFMFLDKHTKS